MESLLSDARLPEEIQAFKATAELLATLKQRLPNSYVPPLEERHKRATLVNVSSLTPTRHAHEPPELTMPAPLRSPCALPPQQPTTPTTTTRGHPQTRP